MVEFIFICNSSRLNNQGSTAALFPGEFQAAGGKTIKTAVFTSRLYKTSNGVCIAWTVEALLQFVLFSRSMDPEWPAFAHTGSIDQM